MNEPEIQLHMSANKHRHEASSEMADFLVDYAHKINELQCGALEAMLRIHIEKTKHKITDLELVQEELPRGRVGWRFYIRKRKKGMR